MNASLISAAGSDLIGPERQPYELKDASPEELSRAICDSEPSKPSEAVRITAFGVPTSVGRYGTASGSDRPPVSANFFDNARAGRYRSRFRNDKSPTKVGSLNARNPKSLRGDLDNIILMALRKEPARRYKSVEQFSEDIRRQLEGLPVIARKDTFTYRASKWIQRNRVASAAAALIALTLLGGIVATTWQARRASAQARLADAKSREAQAALAKTEKINRFMQSIFSYGNPDWFGRAGGRRDVSVLEAMRDVEKRVDAEFKDEPDLRADVYQQIGVESTVPPISLMVVVGPAP